MNRLGIANSEEVPRLSQPQGRSHPPPKLYVANFSYPRSNAAHFYPRVQPMLSPTRDSTASDTSIPPMVEDHGSDFSADEESHDCASGDLLDSFWQLKEQLDRKQEYSPQSAVAGHNWAQDEPGIFEADSPVLPVTAVGPPKQQEQLLQRTMLRPEQRPQLLKAAPKVTYSLFPPTKPEPQIKRQPLPPVPQRQPASLPQAEALEPSPILSGTSAVPFSGKVAFVPRGDNNLPPAIAPISGSEASSRVTSPISPQDYPPASSSSDSFSLILQTNISPHQSPSASPIDATSPNRLARYSSLKNLRTLGLSKAKTRSSPSLAQLAKSHSDRPPQTQEPARLPQDATSLHSEDRKPPPIPLVPHRPPPTPPPVSVFETDSDDGSDKTSRHANKSFCRRLVHGLVHPYRHHNSPNRSHIRHISSPLLFSHIRRGKVSGQPPHKRSVSDEGPSGFSKAFKPQTGHFVGGKSETNSSSGGSGVLARTIFSSMRARNNSNGGVVSAGTGAGSSVDSDVGSGEQQTPLGRRAMSMDLPRRMGSDDNLLPAELREMEKERMKDKFLGRFLKRKP